MKRFFSLLLVVMMILTCVAVQVTAADKTVEYSPGDVNGDGRINTVDVTLIRRYLEDMQDESQPFHEEAADVNDDGRIDDTDVDTIRRHRLGYEDAVLLPSTPRYTVTFKSHDGAILATQIVKQGEGAVAPAAPLRDGYSFVGWSGDYTAVSSHLEVVAVYAPMTDTKYTVTFVDYDGRILETRTVSDGAAAQPPAAPKKSGATFLGWAGTYVGVTQDETVRAVYSDEKNVFVVESACGAVGDTVTVLLAVDGVVETCGFRLDLYYDAALQLISYDDDLDLDIVTNDELYDNGIKLNFSSVQNKNKPRDIIELTFRITDTAKTALAVEVEITEVIRVSDADGVITKTPYECVNGVITIERGE